jgi:hypothetical protein
MPKGLSLRATGAGAIIVKCPHCDRVFICPGKKVSLQAIMHEGSHNINPADSTADINEVLKRMQDYKCEEKLAKHLITNKLGNSARTKDFVVGGSLGTF